MTDQKQNVLILGAGMAGLAAARMLAEAGLQVTLLEAQNRVGGRIRTVRKGQTIVELGAEFIHGRPPDLLALIAEAGLTLVERTGDFLTAQDGQITGPDEDGEEDELLTSLEGYAGPDQAFAGFLATQDLPDWQRERELGYVEGFNAADAREASILALGRQQAAEDAIEGDRVARIAEGYDLLPGFLRERAEAAGATFVFGAEAIQISWQPGQVTVRTADGRDFTARHLVCTAPLGVLQAGALTFTPVPDPWPAAWQHMRMGHVCRFTLVFERRLWPENMSFLLTPEVAPAVWWSALPLDEVTLTGWTGGPRSAPLLALSPDELQAQAVKSLANVLNLPQPEVAAALQSFHFHDWDADPASRGAYSWVPVGGVDVSATLARPIADTLFLAGEHTDTSGHWGTVHAALGSGLRAAKQLLAGGQTGAAEP